MIADFCDPKNPQASYNTWSPDSFKDGQWGTMQLVEKPSPFGTVKQQQFVAAPGAVVVPVGQGFWYISKGGAPEIDWEGIKDRRVGARSEVQTVNSAAGGRQAAKTRRRLSSLAFYGSVRRLGARVARTGRGTVETVETGGRETGGLSGLTRPIRLTRLTRPTRLIPPVSHELRNCPLCRDLLDYVVRLRRASARGKGGMRRGCPSL